MRFFFSGFSTVKRRTGVRERAARGLLPPISTTTFPRFQILGCSVVRVATAMRDHGQHRTCITMHRTKWRPARRSSRAVRPDRDHQRPGSIPRGGKGVLRLCKIGIPIYFFHKNAMPRSAQAVGPLGSRKQASTRQPKQGNGKRLREARRRTPRRRNKMSRAGSYGLPRERRW